MQGAMPCVRPPQRGMHAPLRPVLRGGDRRPLPPGGLGGGGGPGAPAAQQQARQLPRQALAQQGRQHRAEAHHANGPAVGFSGVRVSGRISITGPPLLIFG